ncbi:MAG: hypothetical protein R2838_07270 [Caldilineaceae bacterium]
MDSPALPSVTLDVRPVESDLPAHQVEVIAVIDAESTLAPGGLQVGSRSVRRHHRRAVHGRQLLHQGGGRRGCAHRGPGGGALVPEQRHECCRFWPSSSPKGRR